MSTKTTREREAAADFRAAVRFRLNTDGPAALNKILTLAAALTGKQDVPVERIEMATKEIYDGEMQRAEAFLTNKCCDCMGPITDKYPWRCKGCYDKLMASLDSKYPECFASRPRRKPPPST